MFVIRPALDYTLFEVWNEEDNKQYFDGDLKECLTYCIDLDFTIDMVYHIYNTKVTINRDAEIHHPDCYPYVHSFDNLSDAIDYASQQYLDWELVEC